MESSSLICCTCILGILCVFVSTIPALYLVEEIGVPSPTPPPDVTDRMPGQLSEAIARHHKKNMCPPVYCDTAADVLPCNTTSFGGNTPCTVHVRHSPGLCLLGTCGKDGVCHDLYPDHVRFSCACSCPVAVHLAPNLK